MIIAEIISRRGNVTNCTWAMTWQKYFLTPIAPYLNNYLRLKFEIGKRNDRIILIERHNIYLNPKWMSYSWTMVITMTYLIYNIVRHGYYPSNSICLHFSGAMSLIFWMSNTQILISTYNRLIKVFASHVVWKHDMNNV